MKGWRMMRQKGEFKARLAVHKPTTTTTRHVVNPCAPQFADKAAQQRKETATAGTAGTAQQQSVMRAALVAKEVCVDCDG